MPPVATRALARSAPSDRTDAEIEVVEDDNVEDGLVV